MDKLRRRANAGKLTELEWYAHVLSMERISAHARKGRIHYLKLSGERITDLLSMADEDLDEWYTTIKASNDRRAQIERERMEKMRAARDAQVKKGKYR